MGNTNVKAMANMPNGDAAFLIAFSAVPGQTQWTWAAQWDGGTTWTNIDPNSVTVNSDSLRVLPNDDLICDGGQNQGVLHYDGTTWSPLGALNNQVMSVATDTAGTPYAAGFFTADGSNPCQYLAWWDGSNWQQIAGGNSLSGYRLAIAGNGDAFALMLVGFFGQKLIQHETACQATAQIYATGCASSGGGNTLEVKRLPLLGADYRAQVTGLPSNAIVFDCYGLQAINLPLASVFSFGIPGCALAVDPILVTLELASGSLDSSFPIPQQPGLTGFDFRHQMLVFEVNAQNVLVAATVTDAIEITGV